MVVTEDARVGTLLAGYRVEALLGRGGMSVVYLAEDPRLKRRVALKVLAAGLAADEAFRARFLHESQVAASIDHPHIVPIYEAGESGELLFIAMRYVEGGDLRQRLRHGRLEAGEAIAIVAQVASALDAAHARGLVHRDVKPSNVLLDVGARPDGSDHAYLADFGLTKRLSEQTVGGDGQLLGTIDYVAPEQIAGEEVDGRADVYSLGCVLFECLAGQPPFGRDRDVAVVYAHLQEQPPSLGERRPDLPAALDAVVARALAKQPGERYASARELARAALQVTLDEASRLLAEAAARAAAGRSDLGELEGELASKVAELQLVREQARALSSPSTPSRVAAHGVCPFKGLTSFEPTDADYFLGRERLVAELVARVVGSSFLGIVGPSGSGKSSLLRAGLLPALAGGVLPGSERWRRVLLRPGAHPMSELRRVLVSGTADPVAEALDTLGPGERLLLAVDQLEELFTACSDEAERGAFVETLTRAAVDPDRRAIVVVAARADFYGRCAEYPALASLLGANNVLVVPMQPSELRRAIEVPAARVGLKVEPELTDALVDDVDGEPGALPLLSTSLLELWQKRAGDTLTLAAYRESGGVHGAVARLAETTYARIPDPHRPLVRSLMLRLVGEGEGDAAVRRRAPLAELDLERNEDAARVLATLADSRLVTVSEGSVEVAHEALLREWPRLREWIEEDSQGRRLRRHITQAATEWDTAGKDQGELYRGARLAAALDWSTDHAFELNELERAFVTESREASEKETKHVRRTNRRLRGLLIGAAVLLAAAVIGGVFALVQRGNAREAAGEAEQAADEASTSAAQARAAEGEARAAEARAEEEADRAIAAETVQLAQRLGAQALVEQDLGLSLLLARQAVEIHDSPQTRGYLLADLLRSPAAIGTIHGNYVLRDIALSPDGRTLAVPDIAGLLQFDAQTLEQIGEREYPVNLDTEGVAFSPDGATLALGGDGFIRLVDAHTHEQLAEARIDAGASQIVFSSDGSQLAVVHTRPGAGPDWVTIRDAATLRRIGAPIRPEGFRGWWISQWWTVPSIALTPDGRSLVTASAAGELAWWDLASHEKTRALEIPDGYRALALSPDGETAAIGLDDGIELIHVRTGAVRQSAGSLASNPIRLSFSPDGRTLVSTSTDGTVTLWDAGTATVRETLRGHSAAVQQPAFSRDGKTLYTTSLDGTVIAWDLKGDRRLGRTFTFGRDPGLGPYPDRHPGAFSPDGQVIAVGLKGEGVALWDASDLTQIGPPLLQTGGEVDVLAFSPDGQTLAAVANDGGLCFNQPDPPDPCSVATIWDVESRSLRLGPFPIDPWSTRGVSFSADGTMLATAAFEGVRLWDVATGAELAHIGSRRSAGGVVFSPTEPDVLAFITDGWDGSNVREWGGEAEIWDVARRSRIWTLKPDKPEAGGYLGWAIAFSPDGRLLATGGEDPFVHLWDVRTGKLIRDFEKNVKTALALDFTPDGKTLAMSGGEPYVSLWDVATGAEIGTRLTAGAREALLDLSPYGRQLLMTLSNGEGAVWDIDPESWKQRACELANRTLTPEEWEEFLPGRPYEPACAD